MGEILIDNKPFFFEEIELSYDNATILDSTVAKSNLFLFKSILDKHNIDFWLMHGTLLGAIREHDFIKHDIDIDTYVPKEEELVRIIPELDKVGLKLCRYDKGINYSFIKNGIYIDAYIAREYGGILRFHYINYVNMPFPKKFLENYECIDFLGEKFKVPYHPIKILEFWYGKTWNIPIKNKPSVDRSKFAKFLWKQARFLFKPLSFPKKKRRAKNSMLRE